MKKRREISKTGIKLERINGLENLRELKNSNKTRLEQYIEVK